jgi:hypothetical protein
MFEVLGVRFDLAQRCGVAPAAKVRAVPAAHVTIKEHECSSMASAAGECGR